jgi:DNA-binding GntR family transcriptional regulator
LKAASTLSDKAYRQIKNMFLTDQLVSGQKLPYQDLARRLGMSQTPVIMALVRLEYEGLVRSEANKGFFVPAIDLNEARELYEVRILLEVFLIPAVIENLDDQRLAEIQALRDAHRSIRGEVYKRERLLRDAHFHLGLAAVSGNQVVVQILARVFDLLYLRYKPEILSPQRQEEAEVEHQAVFEALQARNEALTARRLREHLVRGKDRILTGLHAEEQQRQGMLQRETAGLALESVLPPPRSTGENRRSIKHAVTAGGAAGRSGGKRGLAGHR